MILKIVAALLPSALSTICAILLGQESVMYVLQPGIHTLVGETSTDLLFLLYSQKSVSDLPMFVFDLPMFVSDLPKIQR